MTTQHNHGKSLTIAAIVLIVGTFGGIGLAGYAMNDATSASSSSWEPEEVQPYVTPALASVADGPKDYVCRGCGPTLADRRMQRDLADSGYSSDAYPETYEPEPEYRSASVEEGEQPQMVEQSPY